MKVDKTSLATYWSDERHRLWGNHYLDYYVRNGIYMLMFTEEWADQHLPPGQEYALEPLRVVLLDTEDGKLYETTMSASYERYVLDD